MPGCGRAKPKDQPDVKESLRWVEGYEIVADLAETVPDTRLVVADREGDLRALIDGGPARHAGGLADPIPAQTARPPRGETRDRLAQGEPLGRWNSSCRPPGPSSAPGTPDSVSPSGDPAGASRSTGGDRNRDPGPGRTAPTGQPALVWRLLTNRPADTLEDVVQLVDWYRRRWLIEIFSGFGK